MYISDFVRDSRPKGTVVKKVGEEYCVYYATSQRVEGKTYPVQKIKGYDGTIDAFGFHPADRVIVKRSDVIIRECGFSNYLLNFEEMFYLNNQHREGVGSKSAAKTAYRSLIVSLSNNSYLNDTEKTLLTTEQLAEMHRLGIPNQIKAVENAIEHNLAELESLKQICRVWMGGDMFESNLTVAQKALLKKLDIAEQDIRKQPAGKCCVEQLYDAQILSNGEEIRFSAVNLTK